MTTTTTVAPLELVCPRCDYSLRGLVDPRCPECGFAFAWEELTDLGRDNHRWLFEHGRGRTVRTFVATWLRTAWPVRFWRAVTPANPVRLGRLLVYWWVGCIPLLLLGLVATPLVPEAVRMDRDLRAFRMLYRPVAGKPGLFVALGRVKTYTAQQLDAVIPPMVSVGFVRRLLIFHRWRSDGAWFGPAIVGMAWPIVSAGALLAFPWSLRRAKVRPAHVARVAVYGCDVGLLLASVTVAGLHWGRSIPVPWRVTPMTDATERAILLAIVTCGVISTWRLGVACERYLRIDRPWLTVAAAQAIAMLAACAAMVRTAGWWA